jgi:carbonic anhydrase
MERCSVAHLPKSLVEGYRRFRRDIHGADRGRYLQLAELGQTPTAMVIACCDARVDVSKIFDAESGDLFIMRNIANLVPPYDEKAKYGGTSAAVEYAALVLKVPHLVVLGHSHCGGVAAHRRHVREGAPEQGFVGRWLKLLDGHDVLERDIHTHGDEMAFEFAAIRSSIANLRTFPVVREREAEGLLALHAVHFDLGTGQLLAMQDGSESFAPLDEETAANV